MTSTNISKKTNSEVGDKIVPDVVLSERLKPKCDCAGAVDVSYSHMGHAKDLKTLRCRISEACSVQGSRIKIVEVEQVLSDRMKGWSDCPLPPAEDHICRRDSVTDDVLVLAQRHFGHVCDYAFTVKGVVVWEGVEQELADEAYLTAKTHLPQSIKQVKRGCATNSKQDCKCQGQAEDTKGISFSFGCSWSSHMNGCKFKQSRMPLKFNLGGSDSAELRVVTNKLADALAPALKKVAPVAYGNQVDLESAAPECCLGNRTNVEKDSEDEYEFERGGGEADATYAATDSVTSLKEQPRRPFSSVTICLDFSAHRHKDTRNMVGGCTAVATFLRPAAEGKDDERKLSAGSEKAQQQQKKAEQLHIFPAYGVVGAKHDKSNFCGVGIALTNGSIIFECAKAEWHATSPVPEPNRFDPTRISYVFYRHRGLIAPNHGYRDDWLKIRDCQRAARKASSAMPIVPTIDVNKNRQSRVKNTKRGMDERMVEKHCRVLGSRYDPPVPNETTEEKKNRHLNNMRRFKFAKNKLSPNGEEFGLDARVQVWYGEKKKEASSAKPIVPTIDVNKNRRSRVKFYKARGMDELMVEKHSLVVGSRYDPPVPNETTEEKKNRHQKNLRRLKSAENKSSPNGKEFGLDAHVQVWHGEEKKESYLAKILEIDHRNFQTRYLVHYIGWNTRYDEWVERNRIAKRMDKGSGTSFASSTRSDQCSFRGSSVVKCDPAPKEFSKQNWFCPIRRADLLAAVGQVGNSEFSLPDEWCVTLPSRDQAVDESSVTLPSRDQAVNELSRVKDHSSASYAVVTFTKNAFLKKRVKMVP